MPKVDRKEALRLRTKNNLTYTEIAKLQGVTKQSICQALKPLLPDSALIAPFKKNYSDIIKHAEFKQLASYFSLSAAEQRDMILRRGMVDFGILYDKGRLQDGKSTSNIDVHLEQAGIKALESEEQRLMAEIKGRGIQPESESSTSEQT